MQNENNDFEKMQQQAIKRAKEMQQKSSPPGTQGEKPQRPPQENERFVGQQANRSAERFNRPHSHPKQDGFEGANKPPHENHTQCREEPKNEQRECHDDKNPLASLLNLDSDMSMILPLVLLLSKEGADEIMILALLYIMS